MYKRILVPVDGSPTSNRGLEEAVKLAASTGGQLRLLHVVDDLSAAMAMSGYGGATVDIFALLKEGGEQVLRDAKALVEQHKVPVEAVLIEGMSGRLSDHVAAQIGNFGADLVVLGSHGRRGVGRMVLGSDAEQIIRSAQVPVLVVRAPDTAAA
jgi:nucleotide-binding universal stress UspA family protein